MALQMIIQPLLYMLIPPYSFLVIIFCLLICSDVDWTLYTYRIAAAVCLDRCIAFDFWDTTAPSIDVHF